MTTDKVWAPAIRKSGCTRGPGLGKTVVYCTVRPKSERQLALSLPLKHETDKGFKKKMTSKGVSNEELNFHTESND